MKKSTLVSLSLALAAALPALAGGLEVAGYVGPALPTYEQSFRYDPGPAGIRIPGITIEQAGVFQLDGRGGLAAAAGVTWYLVAGIVGLEGRIDTADVDVRARGARYRVRADLPPPIPDLSADLELGSGAVDLERLRPLSLNVKVKTPGPVRLTASGGISYLPEFNFVATQTVGLGVTGFDGRRQQLEIATISMRAEADPSGEGDGRLGVNVGAGLQLPIVRHLALALEARYFYFDKHRLRWRSAGAGPLSPLKEALAREMERRLDPVEFNPTFFQATAGLAVTF